MREQFDGIEVYPACNACADDTRELTLQDLWSVQRQSDTSRTRLSRDLEAVQLYSREHITDQFTDEAIDLIRSHIGASSPHARLHRPFLLVLSYNAPHTPRSAPAEYLARFSHIADDARRTYCAVTAAMDDGIGRITATLRDHDIYNNTLCVMAHPCAKPIHRACCAANACARRERKSPALSTFHATHLLLHYLNPWALRSANTDATGSTPATIPPPSRGVLPGLLDTRVAFLTDNGGKIPGPADNGALKGGKGWSSDGAVRVPMALRWPSAIGTSSMWYHQPVSALDLVATAATAANVRPRKQLDGVDLLPYLNAAMATATPRSIEAPQPHPFLFWRQPDFGWRCGAVRTSRWRLLRGVDAVHNGSTGHWHEQPGRGEWAALYDMSASIAEEIDVSTAHPEVVQELTRAWLAWDASNQPDGCRYPRLRHDLGWWVRPLAPPSPAAPSTACDHEHLMHLFRSDRFHTDSHGVQRLLPANASFCVACHACSTYCPRCEDF